MRLVVQRVSRSAVSVNDKIVSQAGRGIMVLVGITRDDNDQDIQTLAKKLVNLRVFAGPPSSSSTTESTASSRTTNNTNLLDDNNNSVTPSSSSPTASAPFWVNEATTPGAKTWAKSVMDIGGDIMLVSQFTLAHVMKGNKPDFHLARTTEEARKMFDAFEKAVNQLYDAYIKEKSPKPQQQQKGGKTKKQQQKEQEEKQEEGQDQANTKEQEQKTAAATSQPASPPPPTPQVFRGKVAVGAFGEHMEIDMKCDGPVTIVLDSNLGEKEKEKQLAQEAAKKEKEEKEKKNETAAAAVANDGK